MILAHMNKRSLRLLSGLALSALVDAQLRQQETEKYPVSTPPPTKSPTGKVHQYAELEAFYEEHVFQQTTCQTYSMSQYNNNYETNGGGGNTDINGGVMRWGLHALQWKGYNHIAAGGTFEEWTANNSNYPGVNWLDHVQCPHKDVLNTLEQASSGIFDTDPAGTWICVSEPDPHVAAVTAAMSMHYWGTPTYTDAKNCAGTWQCMVGAVIERVTLCAEGALPPHEVCGWDDFDWTTNQGTIGTCASDLALDSVEIGEFIDIITGGSGQDYFDQDVVIDVADWANTYGGYNSPNWDLVFDPPVTAKEEDIKAMQKSARAAAEGMVIVEKKTGKVKVIEVGKEVGKGVGKEGGKGMDKVVEVGKKGGKV